MPYIILLIVITLLIILRDIYMRRLWRKRMYDSIEEELFDLEQLLDIHSKNRFHNRK